MQRGVILVKTAMISIFMLGMCSSVSAVQANSLESFGIKTLTSPTQNPTLANLNLKTAITNQGMVYFDESKGVYFTNVMPVEKVGNELKLVDRKTIAEFVKNIPFAIEHKAPNEKIMVTMFTDITCGWCQKVHANIDNYTRAGISFRFILFPRAGLQSEVAQQMSTIIESDHPYELLQAAFTGQYISSTELSPKVSSHYYSGIGINVGGTPTMVLNGRPIEGYLEPEQILQAVR